MRDNYQRRRDVSNYQKKLTLLREIFNLTELKDQQNIYLLVTIEIDGK